MRTLDFGGPDLAFRFIRGVEACSDAYGSPVGTRIYLSFTRVVSKAVPCLAPVQPRSTGSAGSAALKVKPQRLHAKRVPHRSAAHGPRLGCRLSPHAGARSRGTPNAAERACPQQAATASGSSACPGRRPPPTLERQTPRRCLYVGVRRQNGKKGEMRKCSARGKQGTSVRYYRPGKSQDVRSVFSPRSQVLRSGRALGSTITEPWLFMPLGIPGVAPLTASIGSARKLASRLGTY